MTSVKAQMVFQSVAVIDFHGKEVPKFLAKEQVTGWWLASACCNVRAIGGSLWGLPFTWGCKSATQNLVSLRPFVGYFSVSYCRLFLCFLSSKWRFPYLFLRGKMSALAFIRLTYIKKILGYIKKCQYCNTEVGVCMAYFVWLAGNGVLKAEPTGSPGKKSVPC